MYFIRNKKTYEKINKKFETYHEALVFLKQKYTNNLTMYEIVEDDTNFKHGTQFIYDNYTFEEV